MAWVERLPSGKWRGGWRDPAGRKRYTRRPEFPEHPYARKRDALEAAQEAEVRARRRAAAQQGVASATITFGEWWETAAPAKADSQTAKNAGYIADGYLIPKWGEVPLNQIRQRDAKAWVTDLLGRGLEVSYVHRIWAEFRRAVNLAMETDPPILEASPVAGVKLPSVRRKPKSFVDEDYLAKVRPHLPAHYRAITAVGLECGLRPGELCGLHADMVDLDTGWVTVAAVYVSRVHLIRAWPKDKDSRRVPLTDKAVDIIRGQLAGRDLTAGCGVTHADGKPCRGALVFVNARNGGCLTPDLWRKSLRYTSVKLGIAAKTPYATRRGFATRAARGGVDAFELAALMGHADVSQTREYVQESPAARDRLRVALGDKGRLSVVRDAG